MGLYAYCLVPGGSVLSDGLSGLDGAPVHLLERPPFGVVLSELASAPVPTLERIEAHHAVVAGVMAGGPTPLPMRFGQWFGGADRLDARLRERGAAYETILEDVEGTREFGLRTVDPVEANDRLEREPSGGGGASGREYLEYLARSRERRRELERRARALDEELAERLGDTVRRRMWAVAEEGVGGVSVAHLVENTREAEYRAGVEEFRRSRPEVEWHASGPWPPYSFVE